MRTAAALLLFISSNGSTEAGITASEPDRTRQSESACNLKKRIEFKAFDHQKIDQSLSAELKQAFQDVWKKRDQWDSEEELFQAIVERFSALPAKKEYVSVGGIIRDSNNKPLEYVLITLEMKLDSSGEPLPDVEVPFRLEAKTDAQGRYRFTAVPAFSNYQLSRLIATRRWPRQNFILKARKNGFAPAERELLTVDARGLSIAIELLKLYAACYENRGEKLDYDVDFVFPEENTGQGIMIDLQMHSTTITKHPEK